MFPKISHPSADLQKFEPKSTAGLPGVSMVIDLLVIFPLVTFEPDKTRQVYRLFLFHQIEFKNTSKYQKSHKLVDYIPEHVYHKSGHMFHIFCNAFDV